MDSHTVLGLFLGIFALIGSRRGINRELLALLGIVLAIVISGTVADAARPQVNRFYRYGRAGLGIVMGSDDPGAEFDKVKKLPDLVKKEQAKTFHLAVFCLTVLLAYVIGEVKLPPPKALLDRLLGLFVGAINGYVMAIYLLPTMLPKDLTLKVPAVEARGLLTEGETVARVLFFFIFVLIVFGLLGASGSRRKG